SFAYSPGSSASQEDRIFRITMHGSRDLCLCFKGARALRFEDDCPGFDPLPQPLPLVRDRVTFPLLQIKHSRWLNQWDKIIPTDHYAHFALISFDDLVQLIAWRDVEASWV